MNGYWFYELNLAMLHIDPGAQQIVHHWGGG